MFGKKPTRPRAPGSSFPIFNVDVPTPHSAGVKRYAADARFNVKSVAGSDLTQRKSSGQFTTAKPRHPRSK